MRGTNMRTPNKQSLDAMFAFCLDYFRENDQIPPSRIIAQHMGWYQTTATRRMLLLVKDGRLKYNANGKPMFTDRSLPRKERA